MMLKTLIFSVSIAAIFGVSSLSHADRPHWKDGDQGAPKTSEVENYLTENLKIEDTTPYILDKELAPKLPHFEQSFAPGSAPALGEIFEAFGNNEMNNVIVLGPAGSGKTFLIPQLAFILAYGKMPAYMEAQLGKDSPFMKTIYEAYVGNTTVVRINATLLSQNPTKNGDPAAKTEQRMQTVLTEIFEAAHKEFLKSGRRTTFVIDEVATLPEIVQKTLKEITNKSGFKDPTDEVAKLSDHGYNIVEFTTPEEYHALMDGDDAIDRRFVTVYVVEPTEEEALNILINASGKLQKKYGGLQIDLDSLQYIIHMRNFLDSTKKAMPANILKALDRLYAWSARTQATPGKTTISLLDTQKFLLRKMGLTDVWLTGAHGEPPFSDLATKVKQLVVDQDETVDYIARVIRNWAILGFGSEVPVFILAGPSGSGKDTIVKAFNEVMFGNNGKHMMFSLSSRGFGVDALLFGPPLGNHSDNKPPIIVQKMTSQNKPAMIAFNEGKDALSEDMAKFKEFVEAGEIRPNGRDTRIRPLRFPMFILGQWGEELLEQYKTDDEREKAYANLTSEDIENSLINPKGPEGHGALQPAFVQRVKRSGGIIMIRPVRKDRFADIYDIQISKFKQEQRTKNGLDVEIADGVRHYVSQLTAKMAEDPRGLEAVIKEFVSFAISEAAYKGIPYRNAKIHVDITKDGVVVSELDKTTGKVKNAPVVLPLSQLVNPRSSCKIDLDLLKK